MDLLPFAIGGAVLADWSSGLFLQSQKQCSMFFGVLYFYSSGFCLKNVSHEAILGDFSHHVTVLLLPDQDFSLR